MQNAAPQHAFAPEQSLSEMHGTHAALLPPENSALVVSQKPVEDDCAATRSSCRKGVSCCSAFASAAPDE